MFNKKNKNALNNDQGIIVANNPKSTISEQFRTVRTNLQFSMVDKKLETLCVTSAGPDSGKSLISANLAATFAQTGKRVLLVDTDLRKPTIHKTLQLGNFKGLTTLLTDNIDFDDVVQKTSIENLYVLTSGPTPPNPSEILRSSRMNQIIDQYTQYFDLVIFDTPPILAVTDAQIMASQTDGTLFVVPKGEIKKDQVKKSAELLENVKANVLGYVFNKIEKNDDNYYYYYSN